ncbi:MAG: hypothetical protein WEC73_01060 [Chthoniobacterales bacterium]
MPPRSIVRAIFALPLLGAVLAGCESEDPKIRQEIAELRTRLGDLDREKARLETELKEARSKAARSDFLGREVLGRNLESLMPELRATLTRAFPGLTVDPVSSSTISTPLDEQGFPYNTELTFGLSGGTGQRVSTYTINIKADREGKWRLPDLGAIAALQERRSGGGGQPAPQAGPAPNGPRLIDWGEQNAGAAAPAPAPPSSQPAPAAPSSRPSQPATQAPFPVQDSRTIQFD